MNVPRIRVGHLQMDLTVQAGEAARRNEMQEPRRKEELKINADWRAGRAIRNCLTSIMFRSDGHCPSISRLIRSTSPVDMLESMHGLSTWFVFFDRSIDAACLI
jgi:hypothetical protein